MTETSTHIPFARFGCCCPVCGSISGARAVGTERWGYCEAHLTTWWIGTGDKTCSLPQSHQSLADNIRFLSRFRVLDDEVQTGCIAPQPEDHT